MKRLSAEHLPKLIEKYKGNQACSYFCLSSVHGYSESELVELLASGAGVQFADDEEAPSTLVSLEAVDREQGHARVQVRGAGCATLKPFFANLMTSLGLQRLYSFVFPAEHEESRLLASLGFVREAVFREHVYIDGAYRDVVVYGLLREDA
jgi:hypothetical protein